MRTKCKKVRSHWKNRSSVQQFSWPLYVPIHGVLKLNENAYALNAKIEKESICAVTCACVRWKTRLRGWLHTKLCKCRRNYALPNCSSSRARGHCDLTLVVPSFPRGNEEGWLSRFASHNHHYGRSSQFVYVLC